MKNIIKQYLKIINKIFSVLLFAMFLFGVNIVKAYDFSAVNQGKTIYYNITSSSCPATVEVTYATISYNSYSGIVVIPPYVVNNGIAYTVTSIGQNAFYGCNGLTSVTFPTTLISITPGSFIGATSLSTMVYNCINAPDAHFYGHYQLTTLTIGDSVQFLHDAFIDHSNLTTLNYNAINCPNNDSSFWFPSNNLTTVNIGNRVKNIPNNFIKNCPNVHSITIPNNVDSIGDSAFYNCSGLNIIISQNTIPPIMDSSSFLNISNISNLYTPCGYSSNYQNSLHWNSFTNTQDTNIINKDITAFIITGQSYNLNGFNVNQEGIYSDTTQTNNNCDSITTLHLYIHQPATLVSSTYNCLLYDTIMQGYTYNFHGNNLTTSGIYRDTLQTINGCDSIIILNLYVIPINDSCSISIIPNDTIIHSNTSTQLQLTTNQEATFYHWSPSIGLSDTTIRNPIAIIPPNTSRQYILKAMYEDSVNLVYNGDFESGNVGFTTQYTYQNPLVTHDHYAVDTIINNWGSTCSHNNGMFFMADGSTIPNKIMYQTTVNVEPNTNYAFSVEATNINVTDTVVGNNTILAFYVNNNLIGSYDTVNFDYCDFKKYYKIINSGNNTQLTLKVNDLNTSMYCNDVAMDNMSLKKLCIAYDTINILNYHNIYYDTISKVICQNETYENHNQTDIYNDTIYNINCDTLINVHLTVNSIYDTTIQAKICQGENYIGNGFNQNTTGLYIDSLQTINGCDSIVRLNLIVNPTYDTTI
jgi:hypothetical protein